MKTLEKVLPVVSMTRGYNLKVDNSLPWDQLIQEALRAVRIRLGEITPD